MRPLTLRNRVSGVSLLESLLAILIFSVGILALVALQSVSVKAITESKLRADAGFLASQLIAEMWADVPGTSTGQYAINTAGADCQFGGGQANVGKTTRWLDGVKSALPGSRDDSIQVITTPVTNLVTINICWWPPGTPADEPRRYSTVTQINL